MFGYEPTSKNPSFFRDSRSWKLLIGIAAILFALAAFLA